MLHQTLNAFLRPALLGALAILTAPAAHAGDLKFDLKIGGKKGAVAVHVGGGSHHVGYGGHGGAVISGRYSKRRVVSGCSIHARCQPHRQWVPGHYETTEHQVWIPERKEKVWSPAIYETRYDHCGRPYQTLARPGRWDVVCHPGYYETRRRRVWVPGGFKTSCAVY